MKAYDLKPTVKNLVDTYKTDVIARNADIFRFTEILNSAEDCCSIAIDGNWGSGKTFFVKQVKMVLDAHNHFVKHSDEINIDEIANVRNLYYQNNAPDLQPQVSVYYDAWQHDNDNDPVLSLVYTIMNSIDTDFSFKSADALKIGASIMELFTGQNWPQLIDSLRCPSALDALKEQQSVADLINDFLQSLLPERGNRLVVFVDELDRCKPSYAVRLLERIKHYFSNDNITFVFSINATELQHTIKKHYGEEFDASRYLDRFFDLRVSLPRPDLQNFYRSLNFNDSTFTYDMVCAAIIKLYHFELREIAKFLRLSKIAAYTPTHNNCHFPFSNGRGTQFCLLYLVPLIIGLKIKDIQRYTAFIEGKDCTPLIELAKSLEDFDFAELLNQDETFSPDSTTQTIVKLEDRLTDVYNALFSATYTNGNYRTKVGQLSFDATTKTTLLRTTGLMSQYTTLDID